MSIATTGASQIIDSVHQQVHNGNAYSASIYLTTVTTGDVLVQVGASKRLHIGGLMSASSAAHVYIYSGTTFSAAGTAITSYNMNRQSSNTATPTVTHTPTVTGVGTLLYEAYVPGGTGPHSLGGIAGGPARGGLEWIFNISTNYLIRIVQSSGDCSISLAWYEA